MEKQHKLLLESNYSQSTAAAISFVLGVITGGLSIWQWALVAKSIFAIVWAIGLTIFTITFVGLGIYYAIFQSNHKLKLYDDELVYLDNKQSFRINVDQISSMSTIGNRIAITKLGRDSYSIPVCKNLADFQNMINKLKKGEEVKSDLGENTQVIQKVVTKAEPKSTPEEIREYKKLLDDGIITKEEFEVKKKELLSK